MKTAGFLSILLAASVCSTSADAQQGAKKDSTIKETGNKITEPFDGKEIPQKLKSVQKAPYSLKGLKSCSAIQQEVRDLNEVLGPDVNEEVSRSKARKREKTAGRVAGSAVGSIIPFGGLIGEVTGANAERRRYNRAIYAGTVRRGFLKGVGHERGCRAPARP